MSDSKTINPEEYRFATRAVRAGQERTHEGENSEPIFPTSSFVFASAAEAAARFAGEQPGNIYARFTNPTVRVFEEVLFNVVVAGDYFDIFNWLQALDDELGFVVVKQFDLQPDPGNRTGERLRANFTIVSYREVNDA